MPVYVTAADWSQVRRKLRGMQRNLRKHLRERLIDAFRMVLHDAVADAPEKSGLLKRSLILHAYPIGGTGLGIEIHGTHYAYYQEVGFNHRSAGWVEGTHFCKNAVDQNKSEIKRAVVEAVGESIKRA